MPNPTQSQAFSTPGAITFNVPTGVTAVFVTMIGAGAGGNSITVNGPGAGGAGSGEFCIRQQFKVTSGGTVSGSVGAKGIGTAGAIGTDGGNTTFGPFVATGGHAPLLTTVSTGGSGGGVTGGVGAGSVNPGAVGTMIAPRWFGGGAGGSGAPNNGVTRGRDGAGGPGHAGGLGDTTSFTGGGGGASTAWGAGGAGGAPSSAGVSAASTAYGAGGGGSGSRTVPSTFKGGDGADGYILVEWEAP